jgi:hypothetical protein
MSKPALKAISPTSAAEKDARRWKKELQLAKKREEPWQKDAERIVKRYRGEEVKKNRFNVLWANTEILRPAIYNSRPNPDVRRRFRDADPLGKAVAQVLERALEVFVDGDESDDALKNDVLDGLLSGRGISRIRYVPTISETPQRDDDEGDEDEEGAGANPVPIAKDDAAPDEEVESEAVTVEHVDWRDFRHGYGRVWPEVPWVAFRHKLNRTDAKEKFGLDALGDAEFTAPENDDPKKPEEVGETQKVAEFWEIWDKAGDRVFFTQEALDALLFPLANPKGEPPLKFDGFFPSPRPLTIVENTGSLLPIPLFRLYEQQADELDKISARIDKIINGMRLRGVYDAKLSELADLLSKDDNELTPVANAQAWLEGGLDKAISWMPVEKAAALLESLYDARAKQKAIIDELLGISDIIRGATDPNETATAQSLKSNYGSVRLQRMQKEVQRYARDILRLAATAMAQKFSPETFAKMTELNFPTQAQKQIAQLQMQQQQMQAQPMPPPMPPPQGGQPNTPPGAPAGMPPMPHPAPPPDPKVLALLQMPSWEDVLGVMHSEKRQQYRIDVETDSTIAGTLSSDMQGLSQVLQAVSQTITGLAPLVQDGALPVDAAKELVMAVIRRSRMGMAVEDAFDKMTAPKPPPDPNAGKAQADQATAQVKAQSDQAIAAGQAQSDQQIEQLKASTHAQIAQMKEQGRDQAHQQKLAMDAQLTQFQEEMKNQRETSAQAQQTDRELMLAKLEAMVKVVVGSMAATQASDAAAVSKADAEISRDIN